MKNFSRKVGQVIIPPIAYVLMHVIWFMTRKEFHYLTPIDERQHVCVSWHGELFLTPLIYRYTFKKHPASAIVSSHFDGSLIAGTLDILNIRPLRGSSSKGAKQVLMQAFRSIKNGEDVLITPDGPRGPRHSMSDGAIGITLKSKVPIMVINYQAKNFWQIKSWDKFVIPKPFTKIDIYIQSLSLEGMELEEAKTYLSSKMLEHTIG